MPLRLVIALLVLAAVGAASAATIKGTAGNDLLRGTAAADRIFGGVGNDRLYGRGGNDRLYGGRGNDRLYGERGNDRVEAGPGLDRLFGGPGKDIIAVRDGARDIVSCGPGRDRVLADGLDLVARDCELVTTPVEQFRLSVSTTAGGAVTSRPSGIDCGSDCSELYPADTAVILSAEAASGWRFAGWSGDCAGTTSCTVLLDAARAVYATFSAEPPAPPPPPPPPTVYTLGVSIVGSGTVTSSPAGIDCGSDCSETYASGTAVTLTAAPGGTLPLFIGWAGECTGTGGCTVTMDEDKSVIALFGP